MVTTPKSPPKKYHFEGGFPIECFPQCLQKKYSHRINSNGGFGISTETYLDTPGGDVSLFGYTSRL